MQSFLANGRVADEPTLGVDIDAVLDGRRAEHSVLSRQVIG